MKFRDPGFITLSDNLAYHHQIKACASALAVRQEDAAFTVIVLYTSSNREFRTSPSDPVVSVAFPSLPPFPSPHPAPSLLTPDTTGTLNCAATKKLPLHHPVALPPPYRPFLQRTPSVFTHRTKPNARKLVPSARLVAAVGG